MEKIIAQLKTALEAETETVHLRAAKAHLTALADAFRLHGETLKTLAADKADAAPARAPK